MMDEVLRANEQQFISSPVIFREYLRRAANMRDFSNMIFGSNKKRLLRPDKCDFAGRYNLTIFESEEIFKAVDVESLRSSEVHYNFAVAAPSDHYTIPSNEHRSLQVLAKELDRRKNPQYKSVAFRQLKYDRVEEKLLTVKLHDGVTDCNESECRNRDNNGNLMTTTFVQKKEEDDECAVISTDCLDAELNVVTHIFHGYARQLHFHEQRLGRLLKVTDTLIVRGSSTLLELKNSFKCTADFSFTKDMSEGEYTLKYLSMYEYSSSFFFIHDTFYIDMTAPNAEDISKTVRDWAEKRNLGECKLAHMKDTRIVDLTARLGMPYVFVHQGSCEHLLCFTDLRLWEERDPPLHTFPIRLYEKNYRRVCCNGCKIATAEWVVTESDRMPISPAFLCESCYSQFHLTLGREKVGSFKSAPFCDKKAMDNSDSPFFLDRLRKKAEMERNPHLFNG